MMRVRAADTHTASFGVSANSPISTSLAPCLCLNFAPFYQKTAHKFNKFDILNRIKCQILCLPLIRHLNLGCPIISGSQ